MKFQNVCYGAAYLLAHGKQPNRYSQFSIITWMITRRSRNQKKAA